MTVTIKAARPRMPIPAFDEEREDLLDHLKEDELVVPQRIRPITKGYSIVGNLKPKPILSVRTVDRHAFRHNDMSREEVENRFYDVQDDAEHITLQLSDRRKHGFMPVKFTATDGDTFVRAELYLNDFQETNHECPLGHGGQYNVTLEDVGVWEQEKEAPWQGRVDVAEDREELHPEIVELMYPYNDKQLLRRLGDYANEDLVAKVPEGRCIAAGLNHSIRENAADRDY